MEADLDKGTLTCMSKGLEIPKEMDSAGSSSAPLVKTEAIGNCSLLVEVKQEHEDLSWDTSMENIIASTSVKKVEPDWNQAETEYHTENIFIYEQSKPDPNLLKLESTLGTDLDRSEDASPKEMEVSVKTETTETVFKSEENPDIAEFNIKHEQLDLKDDLEQNQIIVSYGRINQEQTNNDHKHKCHVCEYQTNKKDHFNLHLLKHQNPEEVTLKCDECDFRTLYKTSFIRHQLQHKSREEINWWKCDRCDYQTRQKCALKAHINTRHANLEEVVHFKCDKCDFKTIYKRCLKAHVLQHANRGDIAFFKCHQCEYQTFRKGDLNTHLMRHKIFKKTALNSTQCEYKTTEKSSLKKHRGRRDLKKVNVFQCDKCDYKTIRKYTLQVHVLRHKDIDEVDAFKCAQCQYKTLTKACLKRHLLVHQDPEARKVFQCDKCDFKTSRKDGLNMHIWRHKS